MIGLLFFGILGFYCLVALAISVSVLRRLSRYPVRWLIAPLLFGGLLVLPLADDIGGGRQFAALCKAESAIVIDHERVAGRTVYSELGEIQEVPDTLVPVQARPVIFHDAQTGERLFSYRTLTAYGGWLGHALRFSETTVPFTFDNHCDPGGNGRRDALFRELHITLVERPTPKPAPAASS